MYRSVKTYNFDKQGKRWKKVRNFLADHYTKMESTRTLGATPRIIFRPYPHIIHIPNPKNIQIQKGIYTRNIPVLQKYKSLDKFCCLRFMGHTGKNFWFTLAYFRLMYWVV